MANGFATGPLYHLKPLGGGAEGKSTPASAVVIYWDEPEGAGGLGQIDCDGRDACGGAGQTDWDDCACCGAAVGGGAGQAVCEASGCCAACFGPTVMRVGVAPGAVVPGAADGFCAANFGLGFGLGLLLAVSAAVAGGVGPGTAVSGSGCSGGA